ncbi:aspartyl-phosphate phosphatase Spo0E family protein [Bacillus testis]|uniref:aspartyl-phosphate phosphatase Spo0E family protein n=1 Tax=Bacillus testis TaxID=1622072 RepID=UPI00067F19F1|nr:aspartyl-phosphate phosphatase Spo0E family protein [Bacillus testis]
MIERALSEISSDIQVKRMELIQFASLYGLNHSITIQKSEDLDQVIYEYQISSQIHAEKQKEINSFWKKNFQLAIS